ncbi:hypothetical protein AS203_02880 [Hoylesella enoeca]|uniref:Uncharacterized protein n=1 Tax=Hoylesella enoeca TaxID=76123 RepID=A0A0S2KIR8_9BACT|nr:hypothetical protein AS203_02880 [Hoylesella enoeca]
MGVRGSPTGRPEEKRVVGMPRNAKNWKNEASGGPDRPPGRKKGCRGVPMDKKIRKTMFRDAPTGKKLEKQRFSR